MGGARAASVVGVLLGIGLTAAASQAAPTMELAGPLGGSWSFPKTHLITDYDGHALSGTIKWEAKCAHTKVRLRFKTAFRVPPKSRAVGRFAIAGHYSARGHGVRVKFRIRMTGAEDRDPFAPHRLSREFYGWHGVFKGVASFRSHGRWLDNCWVKRAYWDAKAPLNLNPAGVGSFRMTSEPGDPFGNGASFSNAAPPDSLVAWGAPNEVQAEIGGWNLEIYAPAGSRLEAGRRYTGAKLGYRFDGAPGLRVIGNGRYCDSLDGEFTINSIAIDRWDALRAVSLSFLLHCNGSSAALRGSLNYRRSIDAP